MDIALKEIRFNDKSQIILSLSIDQDYKEAKQNFPITSLNKLLITCERVEYDAGSL